MRGRDGLVPYVLQGPFELEVIEPSIYRIDYVRFEYIAVISTPQTENSALIPDLCLLVAQSGHLSKFTKQTISTTSTILEVFLFKATKYKI